MLLKSSSIVLFFYFVLFFSSISSAEVPCDNAIVVSNQPVPVLTRAMASNFTHIALRCIQREYPNKPDHVISDSSDVRSPRNQHPAFFGCFDWHSSVHGHWMVTRILRTYPDLPEADQIRKALNENLTAQNIALEVAYLEQPNRKSFERTYGWAWLLKLAQELHEWNDPDAQRWSKNLSPLVQAIVDRYLDFLPKQNYAIRTGVHPNTAFGLSFALDYARSVGDRRLDSLVVKQSLFYYKNDKACPFDWEPGGEDFFSPCLIEADLMRRILSTADFGKWIKEFAPDLASSPILIPAIVTDRTDPKLVHLDGLNLSRAWCMLGIASQLSESNPLKVILLTSAKIHSEQGLSNVASGNYEGEHWLASFAVFMLQAFDTWGKE
jgi:hypothetical protein